MRKQRILIAIDTSGSIEQNDLTRFFCEIYFIHKHASEIEVVECDVNIHNRYPYKGICPNVIAGGGGTCFDKPIHLANKIKPDVLIYFTDGYANAPSIKCNCQIIWLITSNGVKPSEWHYLPGKKVQIAS